MNESTISLFFSENEGIAVKSSIIDNTLDFLGFYLNWS